MTAPDYDRISDADALAVAEELKDIAWALDNAIMALRRNDAMGNGWREVSLDALKSAYTAVSKESASLARFFKSELELAEYLKSIEAQLAKSTL